MLYEKNFFVLLAVDNIVDRFVSCVDKKENSVKS